MTCRNITLSFLIKENAMRIMFAIYLGIRLQRKNQPEIVLSKRKIMIGSQEQNSQQNPSSTVSIVKQHNPVNLDSLDKKTSTDNYK